MSTFDKAKKKVKKAAEKTEEEAKETGGKIKKAGKKGIEKARKVGHKTKKTEMTFRQFCHLIAYLSCQRLIDLCFACLVRAE